MFNLSTIIQDRPPSQQREILYYLVRYFKQSHFLEDDGKDVFDDVFDRSPSADIREATLTAIKTIEGEMGQSASQFDDVTADRVLLVLTDIEEQLVDDFSAEELDQASAFLSKLV